MNKVNLPNHIEFEINSACNRKCSYCPNSIAERNEKGDMDFSLFKKAIDELSLLNFSGRISFEFYNEPLLNKNFKDYVSYVRDNIPLAVVLLYSNGTKIKTIDDFKSLKESGVTYFYITRHEDIDFFPFDEVYEGLSRKDKSFIDYRRYQELDFYNRGGLLQDLSDGKDYSGMPCSIPSQVMTISVKGNVLSCFEDFHQNKMMGNIAFKSIVEIWNSPDFIAFRNDLTLGKREFYENCRDCNRVDRGGSHFEKMKKDSYLFEVNSPELCLKLNRWLINLGYRSTPLFMKQDLKKKIMEGKNIEHGLCTIAVECDDKWKVDSLHCLVEDYISKNEG